MKVPPELLKLFTEMKSETRKKPKTGFLGSKSKAYEEAEQALEDEEERTK